MWHHWIAVDPGLLGNVTQLETMWIDNRFENIAAILLSWMLGDPHFSFRRSLPFLILSILTKNKKICTWEVRNISPFMLSCDRSFLTQTNIYRFSRSISPQKKTSAAKVYLAILVMLNWVRLSDLKITNMAYFIADRGTLRSS